MSDVKMVTVNVTQEHIDKGVRCNAYRCPIALALAEAVNIPGIILGVGSVALTVQTAEGYKFSTTPERRTTGLPKEAADFIATLDGSRFPDKEKEKVKPIQFVMPIPEILLKVEREEPLDK